MKRFSLLALIFISFNIQPAQASQHTSNPVELNSYLSEFHRNPKKVMNSPLAKRDENGNLVPQTFRVFANDFEMFEARNKTRESICKTSGKDCSEAAAVRKHRFASINEANLVVSFLYNPIYEKKLIEIERVGLLKAQLPVAPWSDSFWPTTKGLIGRRWGDPNYPDAKTWVENFNYIQSSPAINKPIDQLSASEKYDLLLGDTSFKLTEAMWNSGKKSMEDKGFVPGWAGLCHGWAPAAFMAANPQKSVTLTGVNGQRITFNPSDIKALSSLAWGDAPPRVNFVGRRCWTNDPAEDAVGRVIDPDCFDVNPATWHLGVVHQIGVEKRSFVFDATYDYQVWNYPVHAYSYHYFNPQTLAISNTMNGAAVSVRDFTIDKFKSYRAPNAVTVVGISMDLTYAIPTKPSATPVKTSAFHTVRYVYDLELDAEGRIIGGEWYSNFHPDFIWNPLPGSRPLSKGELQLGPLAPTWDGHSAIPAELLRAAPVSSSKGQPLAAIVEALVARAQEQ